MKTCIYCKATLHSKTRRAHVWQASLGGRLFSREICCDDCNNAISPAEDGLGAALRSAYATVGAKADDGKPVKILLRYADRDFVLANGFADMQVNGARFDRARNSFIVPLPAGLKNQVEALAKVMQSHGLGPEDVVRLKLEAGDPEPTLPTGPIPQEFDLSVGGSIEHKRVFVKMALELLAFHRHDLAVRGELSEARRFARHGTGTFRGKPDTRSSGSGLLAQGPCPEVYNAIEVWTFGSSVFFRAVFLGPIVFTGTLTTEWSSERFRAAYAFDARDPGTRLVHRLIEGDGYNLSIWTDSMKEEATVNVIAALGSTSLSLAQSKVLPPREALPDIEQLRTLVRDRLAKMPRKQPRKAKKRRQ